MSKTEIITKIWQNFTIKSTTSGNHFMTFQSQYIKPHFSRSLSLRNTFFGMTLYHANGPRQSISMRGKVRGHSQPIIDPSQHMRGNIQPMKGPT